MSAYFHFYLCGRKAAEWLINMIGVVGKIRISYTVNGVRYKEVFDLVRSKEIELSNASGVKFRVEEVSYIEDTVYEATLSLMTPTVMVDEYSVGSDCAEFEIEQQKIKGVMELTYFD